MAALGQGCEHARLLGIDFSCGRRLGRSVQKKRLDAISARKGRLKALGRRAAMRISQTDTAPAMRYGAGVTGARKQTVKEVRRFECAVQGEMRGRSAFARAQLSDYDTGALMSIDPIVAWAQAAWDGLASLADMEVAWRRAAIEVGLSENPFSVISGPAGAMLASARRIGWVMPAPLCFRTAEGTLMHLDHVCAWVVRQLAMDDLMRTEAASSSLAARIGGPPDLRPLKEFMRSKTCRENPAVAGSLRALGEGGWWTQARLFEEGVQGVTDPYCRACGPDAPAAARCPERLPRPHGTLHHRCCGCPATASIRGSYKHQDTLARAQSALQGSALQCSRVPVLQPRPPVPALESHWAGGRCPEWAFTFTEHGSTDGALKQRSPVSAGRAGWAAMLVDDAGAVIASIYGPCPDVFPTSLRAELWAVIQMLELALPPLTIWVDNKNVVDGWARGKTWCCSSSRPAADLWKRFWWLLEDIGEGVLLRKCKGHATSADIERGERLSSPSAATTMQTILLAGDVRLQITCPPPKPSGRRSKRQSNGTRGSPCCVPTGPRTCSQPIGNRRVPRRSAPRRPVLRPGASASPA